MKTVYICSPYRADNPEELIRNIEYATKITKEVLLCGCAPITPHLYMTKILSDLDREEREIGLKAGRELVTRCDALVAGIAFGISEGMEAEIELAYMYKIPVINIDLPKSLRYVLGDDDRGGRHAERSKCCHGNKPCRSGCENSCPA